METWKLIPGTDGYYSVSDIGNVRREKRGQATQTGKALRHSHRRGYPAFQPSVRGKQWFVAIHRCVVEAFIGPIPEGAQINHINGVKNDNRVDNLEICTAAYNSQHRTHALGKQNPPPIRPGERNGRAKLSDADIPTILKLRAEGCTQQKIGDIVGIHQTNVSRILRGKTGFSL